MKKLSVFCPFFLGFIRSRWMMVVACFYVKAFAGATYIFAMYSGNIKRALNYDQKTIDTLSFFKDLGANTGIIAGLMNEVMPPWALLAVGAFMNLFGYLMMWLAVTHRMATPPLWQMYLFICIAADSQAFSNTSTLATCVRNFPQRRGVLLGLIKGFVGLSGAIFTQFYYALYFNDSQNTAGILLLSAWLPTLVTLLCMFFVRPMKVESDDEDGKHLFSFLYLGLALALFLTLAIILQNQLPLSSSTYKAIAIFTLLLVASNIVIAMRAEFGKIEKMSSQGTLACNGNLEQLASMNKTIQASITSIEGEVGNPVDNFNKDSQGQESIEGLEEHILLKKKPITNGKDNELIHQEINTNDAVNRKPLRKQSAPGLISLTLCFDKACKREEVRCKCAQQSSENCSESPSGGTEDTVCKTLKALVSPRPKRGDDFSIAQALFSLDMIILFIAIMCGLGSTRTAIDNMGQIGESMGYSQVSINTMVSLINIWNFLGHLGGGFCSETLLRRHRLPRTLVFTIFISLACMGHLMIAFPRKGSLYIASVVIGLSFGGQWPLFSAIISELFGLKHYGILYNVGAFASPLGSYLLNVRVAGYLYDKEAAMQGGGLTCQGPRCFRSTFLIMTAVSFLGSLVSGVLVLRTVAFYRQDTFAAKFIKPPHNNNIPSVDDGGKITLESSRP